MTIPVTPIDEHELRRPAAGSLHELWVVALPMVLSSGSVSLMHVIDRVFLTWHSTDALAAAMPAGLLHWTLISLAIGTAGYVNTFVAQYEGARRRDRVAAAVWQGVYLSLASGVVFLLAVPLTGPIFGLIDHTPSVQKLEVEYFSVLCIGALPMTLSAAQACFFSGRGETVVVMLVNMMVAAANVVLDYGLIFGNFGLPEMGIRGAGLATVIAQTAGVAAYSALMLGRRRYDEYGIWKNRGLDADLFRRLVRFGLPTGVQYLVDIAGFSLFIFLVGWMGAEQLAATNLAFNLNSLAFIPILGVGTAVMVLVGQRIGEGRPELAVRTTWMAAAAAGSFMLACGAVYLFAPEMILYPYRMNATPEEFRPIAARVIPLLRYVAVFSFFDGMAIVFGSAVRGAGDTRFSMLFTFAAGWTLMVAPVAIAWKMGVGSLTVSWTAVTVYIIVLGVGFILRFQQGRWKTMSVIESDAAEAFPEGLELPGDPNSSVAAAEAVLAAPAELE